MGSKACTTTPPGHRLNNNGNEFALSNFGSINFNSDSFHHLFSIFSVPPFWLLGIRPHADAQRRVCSLEVGNS